jgi:hypothetical protein
MTWLTSLLMMLAVITGSDAIYPLDGKATWYRYHAGQAAAGSELREYLGPNWRGMKVRVCGPEACINVTLTDWCGCPGSRVIDLDKRDFEIISDVWRGVAPVTVTRYQKPLPRWGRLFH